MGKCCSAVSLLRLESGKSQILAIQTDGYSPFNQQSSSGDLREPEL